MKTVLNVKGMKCGGCENTVRTTVQAYPGVQSVSPDHKANTVEIEFDEGQVSLETIKKAIADQGFQLT
ncbi:heavy-metal-associated domain-containing protein [Methylococcus sp. EFPC2]|uniref:heavy-metal-associated domain-containing protein n=1 Tax=Methylococcus sp. EFPC2 TaxID=2812648 RepID=UPI0019687F29|nr:heavy-metal-associated domain-containing protein [Methylococcus sp. EFPC2]QSA95892.1 heavy-metal-associated domain-containing protein [Methylococcus sp. EFPC2]